MHTDTNGARDVSVQQLVDTMSVAYWIKEAFKRRAEVYRLQGHLLAVKMDLELAKKGWLNLDAIIEKLDKEINK
ncbi:MAG: hypothetical protein EBR82_10570 [Caulobacteraceae bacterium]|nr:hypothetical protein [Caulobacteraceae bacterium]